MLNDSLLPFIDEHFVGTDECIFQQDNASSHTANRTLQWLENQGIDLLFHPPRSPDLNPIERIWDLLEREILSLEGHPKNLDELFEMLCNCWVTLGERGWAFKLISEMPERIQAVKTSKGYATKY